MAPGEILTAGRRVQVSRRVRAVFGTALILGLVLAGGGLRLLSSARPATTELDTASSSPTDRSAPSAAGAPLLARKGRGQAAAAGTRAAAVPRLLTAAAHTGEEEGFRPTLVAPNAPALTPVKRAVYRIMPKVKRCYLDLLERDHTAEGGFAVRFRIKEGEHGNGKVDSATVEPTTVPYEKEIVSPAFHQCVLAAFASGEFPLPTNDEQAAEQVITLGFGGYSGGERVRRGLAEPETKPSR